MNSRFGGTHSIKSHTARTRTTALATIISHSTQNRFHCRRNSKQFGLNDLAEGRDAILTQSEYKGSNSLLIPSASTFRYSIKQRCLSLGLHCNFCLPGQETEVRANTIDCGFDVIVSLK